MYSILLTAEPGKILGPIAKLLGWIMNGIYVLMNQLFGIENVGLSIILLTILINIILIPLTVKQQKFSKMNKFMQPELKAIQDKYKGKKDEASMRAMNNETSLVYSKYGVSATGSCIQLLIQFPILFALYRVFRNIPAYVVSVKASFTDLVDGITNTSGFAGKMEDIVDEYKLSSLKTDFSASGEELNNYVVDVVYKLPESGWDSLKDKFPELSDLISNTYEHVENFNFFAGINISDTPWNVIKESFSSHSYLLLLVALLIPVLSYVTQIINIKLTPTSAEANDQMSQQMKTMNFVMPILSFVLCFTVPAGLGIYWIANAACRGIIQFIVNKRLDKLQVEDVIKKTEEKVKKKKEKQGVREEAILRAASINTRSISSKANINNTADNSKGDTGNYTSNIKPGSLAEKANMVRNFNERNSNK